MKRLKTKAKIIVEGEIQIDNIKGHSLDYIDKHIENIRAKNPISVTVDGELGKQLTLKEPYISFSTSNEYYKVENVEDIKASESIFKRMFKKKHRCSP